MNLSHSGKIGITSRNQQGGLGFKSQAQNVSKRHAFRPNSLFTAPGRAPTANSTETAQSTRQQNRGDIRLYLDSASVLQWDKWSRTGLLYGFTTNPTILLKDGVPKCNVKVLTLLAQQGFNLGAQEVQLQAWGATAGKLYSTALDLAAIDPRVVVKIPITQEGVEAANLLKANNVRVTMTALYSAHQVLTAISAGVDYAAPYVGRINDLSGDGLGEVIAMQQVVENLGSSMRLLVASIRSTKELVTLATQGLNTFTINPTVAEQLFSEQPTIAAAAEFERAAATMGAP